MRPVYVEDVGRWTGGKRRVHEPGASADRKLKRRLQLQMVAPVDRFDVDVADLCRQEGINATQYYGWKKQLLSSASKVFEDGRRKKRPGEEARKEARIQRLERVIAEITAEKLELKKGLSD